MKSPMPEIAACIALADRALVAGDPLACGDHLGRAYIHLRDKRHSSPAANIYAAGCQIMTVTLGGWVPALLAYARNVRDDTARWNHYLTAHRALTGVLQSCEAHPGYRAEDLATLRAYCAPLIEGTELAIGAALA